MDILGILLVVRGDDGVDRVWRARKDGWPMTVKSSTGKYSCPCKDVHEAIDDMTTYPNLIPAILQACFEEVEPEKYYRNEYGLLERLNAFTLNRLAGGE
jgi:hypothetical protein